MQQVNEVLEFQLQHQSFQFDEKYKSIITEQARKVYLQTYGTVDSKCPIWRLFTKYALQYLGYKFQYYVNSNGRIAIDLVEVDEEE